jgi:hypothetical protein
MENNNTKFIFKDYLKVNFPFFMPVLMNTVILGGFLLTLNASRDPYCDYYACMTRIEAIAWTLGLLIPIGSTIVSIITTAILSSMMKVKGFYSIFGAIISWVLGLMYLISRPFSSDGIPLLSIMFYLTLAATIALSFVNYRFFRRNKILIK